MKYGYHFSDWGLFETVPIIEVTELEKDYETTDAFGIHKFPKKDYVWVKTAEPYFLIPRKTANGRYIWDKVYEGVFLKKYIFDTREEAEEYGRENSNCSFVF